MSDKYLVGFSNGGCNVFNNLTISETGAIRIPFGPSNERPPIGQPGMIRYNNEDNIVEFHNDVSWSPVSWTAPVAFKATNGGIVGDVTGGLGLTKFSNNLTDVSGGSRGSFQVGSSYNTSTGNFTAPYDGLYYFHASVLWNTAGYAATYCSVAIGLSTISLSDQALVINQVGANETFNTNFTQNCAGVVKLDEGQEVCVFTNGNNTSSEITLKFCVFDGYLIQRL